MVEQQNIQLHVASVPSEKQKNDTAKLIKNTSFNKKHKKWGV